MEFWNESKLGASKKMHLLQKKKKGVFVSWPVYPRTRASVNAWSGLNCEVSLKEMKKVPLTNTAFIFLS